MCLLARGLLVSGRSGCGRAWPSEVRSGRGGLRGWLVVPLPRCFTGVE